MNLARDRYCCTALARGLNRYYITIRETSEEEEGLV